MESLASNPKARLELEIVSRRGEAVRESQVILVLARARSQMVSQ